jgi:hypothetical protein
MRQIIIVVFHAHFGGKKKITIISKYQLTKMTLLTVVPIECFSLDRITYLLRNQLNILILF